MKRVLLVLVLVLLAAAAFGQNTGDVLLGGGTNGNVEARLSDDFAIYIDLYGWAGFFLAQGFELGPYLRLSLDREGDYYQYTNIYLGVQGGYYFPTGTVFVPFARLLAAYRFAARGDLGTDWSAILAELYGGVDILLSDYVALSTGARVSMYKQAGYDANLYVAAFVGFDVFVRR